MSTARYVLSRVGQAFVVVWLAFTLVFLAIQAMPGDPVTIFLNSNGTPTAEEVAAMKAAYGYDQPLLAQYLAQLGGLFTGDLGYSLTSGQPVITRIGSVAGSTLVLAGSAFVTAVVIALALVTAAVLVPSGRVRALLSVLPPLLAATPVFWLGLIALQVLSLQLGWVSLFPDGSVASTAVPVAILALFTSAPIAQVLLTAVQRALTEPYVDVLRARGASEARILFGHVLRAAAPATLTVMALAIGTLLAGSVITETVFARPGIGTVVLQAVTAQDVPLVQGVVLLTAAAFAVANLAADLAHPLLDPRVLARR